MLPAKIDIESREKNIHRIAMGFLIFAGLVYSISYFGYYAVPNSDFPAFLATGQEWLHFQIPSSMKRAPVFSIITALAGLPFSRPDRYLFGSEVYCALLLPVIMVLIYSICRKMKIAGAIWIALIAGISPWLVRMSSEPLAELTIVTLFAATVFCVRGHIKLAYLFAALASITRWDMAALIPAVALADFIQNRKARTILRTLIASIPFLICMIITAIQHTGQINGADYIEVLKQDRTFGLVEDLRLYWKNIMSFLNVQLIRKTSSGRQEVFEGMNSIIFGVTAFLLGVSFLAGTVFAFIRKQWEIIVMLIAGIPYVLIHAIYPYRMQRFCVPVQWCIFIIAVYGAEILWRKFSESDKRKPLVIGFTIAGIIVFIVWVIKIGESFAYAQRYYTVITTITILVSMVGLAIFLFMEIYRGSAPSGKWLLFPLFLIMATLSSGANINLAMGDGQQDANFKKLAEWFYYNAKENDKMITTMPGFMPIFTGMPQERFVHTGSISVEDANNFVDFIEKCREEGVTLIAWDSRLPVGERYYKLWGLDRIEALSSPIYGKQVDVIDRCKLLYIFTEGKVKIAIYRIMPD